MVKASTRKKSTIRFSLIAATCCLLYLIGIFMPGSLVYAASSVHAIPATCAPNNCEDKYINGSGCTGVVLDTYTDVYDSYNHLEGTIRMHHSTSCSTVWATFASNSNTWQHVIVYTEFSACNGYYNSPSYDFKANTNFDAPMMDESDCGPFHCFYGEVDLIDNRGQDNWQNTDNDCF